MSGYRFVRPPLIVRDDVSHDVSDVTVYFRLNRRLPNGAYGEVDGEPPASRVATSFVPDNERCSMQYAGGTKASHWRGVPLGTRATFALHIPGLSRPLKADAPLMAPLPVQKNASGIGSEGLAYERRLGCVRADRTAAPLSRTAGERPYRFVHQPVVVYAMLPGPVYHVVFRLDHHLVRDRLGVRASVELNQTGDPTKPINFARPLACYVQELERGPPDPVLQHPKTGRTVTLTLRIKAPMKQTLTAGVRLRRVSRAAFDAPGGAGTFQAAGC